MESQSPYKPIHEMFNYIDSQLNKEKNINNTFFKGGNNINTNNTQPYETFNNSLNRIYDYFKVIFENNNANTEKYAKSHNNLENKCDGSQYKCSDTDNDEDEHQHEDVFKDNSYDNDKYEDIIETTDESIQQNNKSEDESENNEPTTNISQLLLKKDVY